AIDERTAVVSITAVCYRNGVRLPVEEIARIGHEHGTLVLLDAYQAIGTYPLDVTQLGVDALAAGVLKYLLGSAGLGFLWVRPGLSRELLPTETGWFADQNIFEMDHRDYSPSDTARRFQSGTPPIPSDRKSTRLNSSHGSNSYAGFCLKKKKCGQSVDAAAHRGVRRRRRPARPHAGVPAVSGARQHARDAVHGEPRSSHPHAAQLQLRS